MNSTVSFDSNWDTFEALTRSAVADGANWILTPENTFYLGAQFHKVAMAQRLSGPWISKCKELALELQIHLFIGSIPEVHIFANEQVDHERCFNTSVVISPLGEVHSIYRKVHLFDVDISGGLSIKESDRVIPGTELVIADIDDCKVGLTICYDLRFAEMYRGLGALGANILIVPSAFTNHTGKAHWHTLLQARAIENQSWVLAPAQTGIHDKDGKRHSYGHSLIIDPWGRVIKDAGTDVGYIIADIDLEVVSKVRQSMPVSEHRVFK